mmetsp:Transcript_21469/g.85393  ORF Transcript_21469/g.85393 Transcript_21469/m.85393 type:complete len:231 (+) Transcript_21469:1354-2046(+)
MPSWITSWNASPRCWYRLAIDTTSRRFAETMRLLASRHFWRARRKSPVRAAASLSPHRTAHSTSVGSVRCPSVDASSSCASCARSASQRHSFWTFRASSFSSSAVSSGVPAIVLSWKNTDASRPGRGPRGALAAGLLLADAASAVVASPEGVSRRAGGRAAALPGAALDDDDDDDDAGGCWSHRSRRQYNPAERRRGSTPHTQDLLPYRTGSTGEQCHSRKGAMSKMSLT